MLVSGTKFSASSGTRESLKDALAICICRYGIKYQEISRVLLTTIAMVFHQEGRTSCTCHYLPVRPLHQKTFCNVNCLRVSALLLDKVSRGQWFDGALPGNKPTLLYLVAIQRWAFDAISTEFSIKFIDPPAPRSRGK